MALQLPVRRMRLDWSVGLRSFHGFAPQGHAVALADPLVGVFIRKLFREIDAQPSNGPVFQGRGRIRLGCIAEGIERGSVIVDPSPVNLFFP